MPQGRLRRVLSVVAATAAAWTIGVGAPAGAARLDPGDLDPGFGDQGKVILELGALASCNDVEALGSGKLVAAGYLGHKVLVMRFRANGTPDPTFGDDGIVTTSFAGRISGGKSVSVDGAGRIVVAGTSDDSSGQTGNLAVMRYLPGGGLDHTFSGDGKAVIDVFGEDDLAEGLGLDANGRPLVASMSKQGGVFLPVVIRLTTNGQLDHAFDADGIDELPPDGSAFVEALAVQGNGKAVAAGIAGADFGVYRTKALGGLDPTFGTGGAVYTDFDHNSDVADALAIDSKGRILAAGQAVVGGEQAFAVARYTKNGDPDPTFDGEGVVSTDAGAGYDRAFAMVLEGAKIVVGGRIDTAAGDERWGLVRYKAGGAPDGSFGAGGIVTTNFGVSTTAKFEEISGLALQAGTGRIIACGLTSGRAALAAYVG